MQEPKFVHLRLHSEYSLVDSVIRIEELFEHAKTQGLLALGLTDHNNLFAAVKFYQEALSTGLKPILGVDIQIADDEAPNQTYLLTLLCQNYIGYRALSELVSRAYVEGQGANGQAKIYLSWLTPEICQHLIALQNHHSILAAYVTQNPAKFVERLTKLRTCFPDRLYIELSRTSKSSEMQYEKAILPIAAAEKIPLVATNDVRFLVNDDFEAHEARTAIYEGAVLTDSKRIKKYTEDQYLRSVEEMCDLFADLPSALTNIAEIAKRCNLILELGKTSLPQYPTGNLTTEEYLIQESRKGLTQRLQTINHGIEQQIYSDRLELELKVITQMGFSGYFLIVADFIAWSKQNGIPVGPGRGSGAGSLVAYALGITDLDPLPYDLLFERFLNPERVSMPDFDIDFCMDGRDRVIEYVAEKYGRDSVSQIITYGSMAAKAVVRDVGRVLGHPYGFVDKIAKLVPFELGITLEKAMEQEAELKRRYDDEEDVKTLLDLALRLEGLVRNAGKHAGGVVIAPSKLTDFTPLYCEANGENLVSQFDKDDVEAVGLVKFDFLGLRTLTIIDWAVKNVQLRVQKALLKNSDLDKSSLEPDFIAKIPLDDVATYELLQRAQTTAVFQLESRGMKDLIKRLKPDCFEDIIALVALFRPGPLQSGMVDDFIERKHGAKIEYPHPDLEPILKPTYGIILYQEQVMQIAQVLAGYTLGAADLLRRAMGKKKVEEMAEQREIFVSGATQRGVKAEVAAHIFDLMEKFAGYGFNKSHSAAYALLSYQTAWLKTHFPVEFMAAVLSSDMDNTDKVVNFINECFEMGIEIIPPDINRSQFKFTVDYSDLTSDENKLPKIIYGLGAIKGAGEAAMSGAIIERETCGAYKDLFDFCHRNDLRKINKRVMEALVKSGSFDNFQVNRATLWNTLDTATQRADQKSASKKQHDLFGLQLEENAAEQHYLHRQEWSLPQKLQGEKDMLGWYISGHPLSAYKNEVKQFKSTKIQDLSPQADKTVRIIAQLTSVRMLLTKRGDRMAILSFADETGKIDCALFSEELEKNRNLLQEGEILLIEGNVDHDNFTQGLRMSAKKLSALSEAREWQGKALVIEATSKIIPELCKESFKQLLQQSPGNFPIYIRYQNEHGAVNCQLGSKWRIKPSDELLLNLREYISPDAVSIEY